MAADRWDLTEGDHLAGDLYALRRLGGGKSYEVWLAFDERRMSAVAAKLPRPSKVSSPRATGELAAEATALSRLSHPAIVRMYASSLEPPVPYVSLEHLEGPTLRSAVRRQRFLALEQVVPLALQLASALHYMHAEGFLHLDVKPSNVVLAGEPRLIDLSIACTLEDAARRPSVVGTHAYMAPEQCVPKRRGGSLGPATDVFALGATVYEAMTGRHPFLRPGERAGRDHHPQRERTPHALPRHVPAMLGDLVLSCLRADPAERPTTGDLVHAMQPVAAMMPTWPAHGRRKARGFPRARV